MTSQAISAHRIDLSRVERAGDVARCGHAAALAVAGLVSVCFVSTSGEGSLPARGWAATFLFLAVAQDVRNLRIPNWLTFPSLLVALTVGLAAGGLAGLGHAALGAALALGVFVVPYLLGGLGAGDVKAAAVLGALWGAPFVLPVFWWMLIAGGLLALAWIAVRGGLPDLLRRWLRSAQATFFTRRFTYFAPGAGSAAGAGLPFAVAMGLGAAAYQLWGTLWH